MSLEFFKSKFYRNNQDLRLHLNNAGLSPISHPAKEKIIYWAKRFYEEGFYTDQDYMQDVFNSRQKIANLVGCDQSEIAFFQSTASAISQLCFNFPLGPNDEVVMWDQEYSSHLYPWQEACKRSGAQLILATSNNFETPVENLLKCLSSKTKVVAISWVQFQTGAMSDLEIIGEYCRENDIFFFVDIMQGLGLHPFDMKKFKIDACASGSHKWLVSPVGVGFLAIETRHIKMIRPHNVGASTFGTCDDPSDLFCSPKVDALKFEPGSKQVLEITALGASVELILKTKVEVIEKEVIRLSSKLRAGLEGLGFEVLTHKRSTSIVNFKPKKDTEEKLKSIPCLFAKRGPGFRLSPHAHNTDRDIEIVLNKLAD